MANKVKRLSKKVIYEMVKENPTMLYSPMPEEIKAVFPVITMSILSKMGFHFTEDHNGKMVGMKSLSTTCKCNIICIDRIKNAFKSMGIDIDDIKDARKALLAYIKNNPYATNISICGFCFSDSQQDYMTSMQDPLSKNHQILNGGIIHPDWLPALNTLYFRGESFGDFASSNAVINFWNLAKKNPDTHVTAWTKNLVFFGQAVEMGYEKPDNFKLVLSSRFINNPATIPEKYAGLADAVFTVYTKEYSDKFGIKINCGARSCLACLRCYIGFDGSVKYVNELLK